jgi:hypothetical protein
MIRTAAVVVSLLLAAPLAAQLADGDAQWEHRADGAKGGHAAAAPINAAIAAYEKAIVQAPNDLEPRWKLMRAIRFKGAYVATTADEKKTIYSHAKKVGADAIALLGRQIAPKGVNVQKASEKQVADAARAIPGTAEMFMWDSANWGEWALAYGKLAAAREGAADRIRRSATIAMLIDPKVEGGGPARVLGRLHDQTPRIPFITGWASGKEAVKFLNEAVKIEPKGKVSRVFLAEALASNDSSTKPRAIQILRDVISSPNDPAYAVEDAAAQDDARALLKKWGA